jgi:hypothetical protein
MTETALQTKNREYAQSVFGNCDDGTVDPDTAVWEEEAFPVEQLRHLHEEADLWLKADIDGWQRDYGESSHWEKFLKAENFQAYLDAHCDGPPVISIDENQTIQIWDGWHRIACALVRGEKSMTICVGRRIEPVPAMAF